MPISKTQLAVYAAAHAWVDFCCALLLFGRLWGTPAWALCVLLYNFCAFALQMPIGLLADRRGRGAGVAAVGCALVGCGFLLAPLPLVCAVAAGLGNACFHVGGGVDVLNAGTQKSAALGIFVCPGAAGLYVGTLLGKTGRPWALLAAAGLLGFGALLLYWGRGVPGAPSRPRRPVTLALPQGGAAALTACFAVVVLRSYIGMMLAFPWKSGPWAAAVLGAVVLGKAAGGFAGDAFGPQRAAAGSLGLAALLFCFSGVPLVGVAAVFLFNMSMPLTLAAAARWLPGARGFAFGLLTFALFVGFLPVDLGWQPPITGAPLYAAGAVASGLALVWGLRKGGLP